jgi:hypothetical protein
MSFHCIQACEHMTDWIKELDFVHNKPFIINLACLIQKYISSEIDGNW